MVEDIGKILEWIVDQGYNLSLTTLSYKEEPYSIDLFRKEGYHVALKDYESSFYGSTPREAVTKARNYIREAQKEG